MSPPPSKNATRKRSCEESSSDVAAPRYLKQRKLEEHFPENINCAQENDDFHFFPAAGRQLMLSDAKKNVKGKRLKLRNLFDSAARIIHQFSEIIAPCSNDDDDEDDVEEQITVSNEFDAIPSCSKAIQTALPIEFCNRSKEVENADDEIYKESLEPTIPPVHATAAAERVCRDQPVVSRKNSVIPVESATLRAPIARSSTRRLSILSSGNFKCGALGSALNSFDNEITLTRAPLESNKLIGRINEDEVNGVAGLNNIGISAVHDPNMHCLSAEEGNKGLVEYKRLLDEVLPGAIYGVSGDDSKSQSFVKRTRSGKQSDFSLSMARNGIHNNKKSLAYLPTIVIDETEASDNADKDDEKPQVIQTRAKIRQQEKQTSLGLGNACSEKIKPTDVNLTKPDDTGPCNCHGSPLFDDIWLQNFKANRQLRRDSYINEIKQITNIVVGLVNDRRAVDFTIKEHLRRLNAVDFELHATGDSETEFVELTAEHLSLINTAITGPLDQILVSKFHINISRFDIRTLCDNNWLNDKIIDFYMKLLIERSERKSPSSNLPSVYAMGTFFVPRLMSSGYDGVKRWTNKVDIFSKDILLIPINLAQVHWSIVIINLKERTIKYYDSMGYSNPQILATLEQYLKRESMDKRKQRFQSNRFVIESVLDGPQQVNGNDCGVVCCAVAEYITRNKNITFSGKDMKHFRKKMILEIIQRELMQ
uniref:Ubiquitin-like protease family profile domain-containing protein n=1 Tax=Glossina palpalis gambiensis TaxID=67801 RepID=A0A1B0BYW3_9MUSC